MGLHIITSVTMTSPTTETFRPFADRVLVLPDDQISHASTLIQIAARDGRIVNSQEQFGRRGTVIAIGPGKRDRKGTIHPLTVKPGDKVYFGEFQNAQFDLNGRKHFVIQEADITGVEDAAS